MYMTIFSLPRVSLLIIMVCIGMSSVVPVHAATPSRSSYYNFWRYSSEGRMSTSTMEQAISRRGVSSAARKAIDELDDDPVEDLYIPVLLGVKIGDLFPNFGDPRDGGSRSHEGEDILAPEDDYIVSPTDAVVTSMGNGSSSGNYVYTANPGGETFVYMHLDKFAEGLKTGAVLDRGDLIGYVGNTGNAAGGPTHLHFEIRHNRTAIDPFPRLTKEFDLDDRIEYIENALDDADDPKEDVEMLVANFRSIFIAAQAQDIDLPKIIEEELVDTITPATSGLLYRDLTVGSQGSDVVTLQAFLIKEDTGKASDVLADAGATGYFGAITKAALVEYQADQNISPAAGYFGPITRAFILKKL